MIPNKINNEFTQHKKLVSLSNATHENDFYIINETNNKIAMKSHENQVAFIIMLRMTQES